MHRHSTIEERETQLAEWEAHLNAREADLAQAIRGFRDSMEKEVKNLNTLQHQVAERELQVQQRLSEVQQREHELLKRMHHLTEALASTAGNSPTAGRASTQQGSGTSPASSPRAPPTARSVSPAKYAEGFIPVDPAKLSSYVEELSDSNESMEKRKPRGLQGSPQFQPMDPDDSGLSFLRKRRVSIVNLPAEDSLLQDEFDEAVDFLVNEGYYTEDQILEMMQEGALTAQDVVDEFHELASGNAPAVHGLGDGEVEENSFDADSSGDCTS